MLKKLINYFNPAAQTVMHRDLASAVTAVAREFNLPVEVSTISNMCSVDPTVRLNGIELWVFKDARNYTGLPPHVLTKTLRDAIAKKLKYPISYTVETLFTDAEWEHYREEEMRYQLVG